MDSEKGSTDSTSVVLLIAMFCWFRCVLDNIGKRPGKEVGDLDLAEIRLNHFCERSQRGGEYGGLCIIINRLRTISHQETTAGVALGESFFMLVVLYLTVA